MTPNADVVPIFLRVPRAEIAYIKFVFESYEGIAVVRTLDRHAALLAVLAAPDFETSARAIVRALASEAGCEEVPAPPGPPLDLLGPDVSYAGRGPGDGSPPVPTPFDDAEEAP
jgi:Domain of unknown function (DUF4911)